MKKLIVVFVAMAITAGAYAQAGSTNGKTSPQNSTKSQNENSQNSPQDLNKNQNQNMQNSPQDLNKNQNQNMQNNPQDLNKNQNQNMQNHGDKTHADGLIMQNGKMMKVKNGQLTSLDNDVTLSNGTKISSDGTCVKKDGTKMTMKDGQHMDMSGNMTPSSTNKDGNKNLLPDSTKKKTY